MDVSEALDVLRRSARHEEARATLRMIEALEAASAAISSSKVIEVQNMALEKRKSELEKEVAQFMEDAGKKRAAIESELQELREGGVRKINADTDKLRESLNFDLAKLGRERATLLVIGDELEADIREKQKLSDALATKISELNSEFKGLQDRAALLAGR